MAGNSRILFIDDDPLILRALATALAASRDWQIEVALGGEAGVAALARAVFDVIVTDLNMPVVDGRDVLAAAKAAHPAAVRVVLTGATLGEERLDAHMVVTKPCSLGHLRELIDRAVRKRHETDA